MTPLVTIEAMPRLDSTTGSEFSAFTTRLVEAGANRLILDFSEVDYLGSAGVRALMQITRSVGTHQGHLMVAGCRPSVLEVLRICGLVDQLRLAESVEAARQRF